MGRHFQIVACLMSAAGKEKAPSFTSYWASVHVPVN